MIGKKRRLIESAVFENDMAEDVTFEDAAFSKIPRQSDEPFLNQEGIKDDAKEDVVKETSNTACFLSWEFSFCRDG